VTRYIIWWAVLGSSHTNPLKSTEWYKNEGHFLDFRSLRIHRMAEDLRGRIPRVWKPVVEVRLQSKFKNAYCRVDFVFFLYACKAPHKLGVFHLIRRRNREREKERKLPFWALNICVEFIHVNLSVSQGNNSLLFASSLFLQFMCQCNAMP